MMNFALSLKRATDMIPLPWDKAFVKVEKKLVHCKKIIYESE